MSWLTRRFLAPAAAGAAAGSLIGPSQAQAQTADARVALAASSVIEEIKRRGSLRIGMTTFVPWAFRNRAGELVGYEIDVATRLAQDMGVRAEFVPTAWDGIIPALLAGRFDFIIGGMTITPQRNLSANFSASYSAGGVDLAANKRMAESMTTVEAWNRPNVTIAARRGTSALATAQRLFPRATIRQFDDDAQSILEVVNGRAHGMVGSAPRPRFAVAEHAAVLFSPFTEVLARQADAIAVRKGDPDALNFLNNWILNRQLDGWLDERAAYWFRDRDWRTEVAPG